MTRKALSKFDPNTLGVGKSRIFEVRNRETGFGEHHYFYRDDDGELFTCVCKKGMNEAVRLRDEWKKKKHTHTLDLKLISQDRLLDFIRTPELNSNTAHLAFVEELARRNKMIVDFLAEIESDERLGYPTANTSTNAPLALIQCALDNQRKAIKHVIKILNGEVQG